LPLDKAPLQVRKLPLVFLPERLELPTASGTDVALTARKLRLLGQLRSGLGPWGAIVSAAAATTIAARAAMAPAATVNVIDSKVLQFRGVAFSSPHRRETTEGFFAGCMLQSIAIQRRDGAAVQDWRDLQAIKNELFGAEHEAIELYPAESRVVDTQNQFHLWVLLTYEGRPRPRFPVGWSCGKRCTAQEAKGTLPQREHAQ